MRKRSITMVARGRADTRAVAAVGPAGYNSALSRLKGTEDQPLVAVKKPARKATKAAKTSSRPAAGKPSARKPAVKKAVAKKVMARKPAAKKVAKKTVPAPKSAARKPLAKKAPGRAVAKKTPAKAVAAKKPAATKLAAAPSRPIGRQAPVAAAKAQAPKQAPATNASSAAASKPVARATAKPEAKEPAQRAASSAKAVTAPRPVGKVAVAVVARPAAPAPNRKIKVIPYKTDEATGRPILPAGYRPGPDEEYMGALQTEYFRQRLFSWRADLVEESKQTIENLKDEVRDVGDEAERATRETENSLELRTRDRYRKLIGKIDSTLKRLDSGEYGYSVDSGEEIGLERLEARLTAERTIDEQERWEHLQKQIGD